VAAALAIPLATASAGAAAPAGVRTATEPAATRGLSPFSDGMPASLVLGQSNFTTNQPNVTPTNVSTPISVAVDSAGDVWVSDESVPRVVEYRAPVYSGEPASVVLGQSTLYSAGQRLTASGMDMPFGIAFSPSGDLWVADYGFCRITEFVPPFTSGMAASVVIGQSSFTTSTCGHSEAQLRDPNGIAVDPSGDLFVADSLDNRVVEFTPPFSNGMLASAVLGQSTWAGDGGGTSAVNLSCPLGVAASASMVWVGDSPCGNSRIMGFPQPVKTNETATAILGQASFTSSGATGDNVTYNPNALAVDSDGNLYAVDYDLNRVDVFTPPFTPFKTPTVVLGQSTLSGVQPGLTATNLSEPRGVAVAPNGTLWVVDYGNARILGYVPATFSVTFQESGLPAGSPWAIAVDGTAHLGTASALAVRAINGTHAWTVGPAPPGYHVTSAAAGTVTVNGTAEIVTVAFAQNSSSPSLLEGLGIGIVVGLVAGAAVGILLGRRRKSGPSGAAAWSGPGAAGAGPSAPPAGASPPPAPPPASGGPPPGATG